jgi:cytosine/adenosine deaminase-related metal-dependent hydrolase
VDEVRHGTRAADPTPEAPAEPRPVILATFSVRIDPDAERFAFDSARDVGARLIVANLMMLPPYPTTLMLAREYVTLPHEEDLEAVRATAARAGALGIGTELLRITSRRPLAALVELISERRASLVVLGPDARRAPRWQRRLAARRVRRQTDCLIWTTPDDVL